MMDLVLEIWVSLLIEWAKLRWMLGGGRSFEPGEKLKLLFAGYNGTRNTGSDVRVEEMLRQIRHILGGERISLSVLSQNFELSRGYFRGTRQVRLPDIFPAFLATEIPKYDGVVACEGSMFKSKFANALTTMMIGSLGMASAQNKLSIGYGAEAGLMDPLLEKMCHRYCRESTIVTRNAESLDVLGRLGISTELGTDTAWTFECHGPAYARKVLRAAGWDESSPLLAICPINPYWWPVKASLAKATLLAATGAFKESHYRSLYFHHSGSEVESAYNRYLTLMAKAVAGFRENHHVFPILVAMERLDATSCRRMSELLGGSPIFTSDDYDMYELVSILRNSHMIVSSRYHAIVTSMTNLVPSAGITMDERIRNLMHERGHPQLLLEVDDPDLDEKLGGVLQRLHGDREEICDGIGRTVAKNLKTMARMGVYFEQRVQRCFPDFSIREGVFSWEDYLPPLSPNLRKLVDTYDS